jgi:hypothetical protein
MKMDKETRTLMTVAIATVVGIALLLTVAGASAGAAFLLTQGRAQSEGSLTQLTKASLEASIIPASSSFRQASMLVTQDDDGNNRFSLSGELNEVNEETIVVAQQVVQTTNATLDLKTLQVGSHVVVQGSVSADGMLVAEAVYPTNSLETGFSCAFTGQVENIDDQKLVVEGKTVILVDATVMAEDIRVDDRVAVECLTLANGEIIATRVKWLEDEEMRQFEFQGKVESIDPWVVGGKAISLDSNTQVETGVQVGSMVIVKGVILDDTWLSQQIIILNTGEGEIVVAFFGTVESTDPWILNGLTLILGENAEVERGIRIGALVRVEAVLSSDGKYIIRSIHRFEQEFQDGCFSISDIVVRVDGNRIRLQQWPELIIGEDVIIKGELRPGSPVLVTVCRLDDQLLVVRSIEVFERDNVDDAFLGENKVTICHIPPGNPANRHTITVGESAVDAHVSNHGDTLGPCP